MYSFDQIIDRRNSNCLKWDFLGERHMPPDVLPLWVADMDILSPPAVIAAMQETAAHGIYGYTRPKSDFFETVQAWFLGRFQFSIEPEWMLLTPGVVFALSMAIRAYTKPGESVLIQTPIYPPFMAIPKRNGRKVVQSPLLLKDGRYEMDFEDLEVKMQDPALKLMLLCSPHNPVGRVWKKEELLRLFALAQKNNVCIVSDEIHCDFAFEFAPHTLFASLNESARASSVLLLAPSKTFNIAGMQLSVACIADEEKRRLFREEIAATGYSDVTPFSLAAARAAYKSGAPWLDALLPYLQENIRYVQEYLNAHIPQIKPIAQDGCFLMWLDCRALHMPQEELVHFFAHEAKLYLNDGAAFGTGGEGFMRLNIGCPRATLEKALPLLKNAWENRKSMGK